MPSNVKIANGRGIETSKNRKVGPGDLFRFEFTGQIGTSITYDMSWSIALHGETWNNCGACDNFQPLRTYQTFNITSMDNLVCKIYSSDM